MATLNDTNRTADPAAHRLGPLFLGLYAWSTAAYFGSVWLDFVYARELVKAGAVSGAVADLLLVASAAMALAGVAALALAWNSHRARGFLLASLVLAFLMFPAPAVLSVLLGGSADLLGGPIRLALTACISVLAFVGFGALKANG
jgi:hypothetical protein